MVNVESRIDVKTKNGLTIFSSSQIIVRTFVVTHFLSDLALCVVHMIKWAAKQWKEKERKMAKHFRIDFHKHTHTHMLYIYLKCMWALWKGIESHLLLAPATATTAAAALKHTVSKFKDFICSLM